jgi:hypothetical protein
VCLTGDLFPKNNVAGRGCTHEATMVQRRARRLRSSVELRQSLEECVMCMVARSSMHTGCACGGMSVCVFCMYVQILQLYLRSLG